MTKGVDTVEVGKPVDIVDWMARTSVGLQYRQAIWEAIDTVEKNGKGNNNS
jgi:hypothetical protein